MIIVVSLILLIAYALFYCYCFSQVLKGHMEFLLYYVVIFFPIYTVFLALVYNGLEVPILISILQYSKELIIFSSVILLIFGRSNLVTRQWHVSWLDTLFLSFLGLSFIYMILPIGEADFVNKAIYFKNILLIGVFYFFGRNLKFSYTIWSRAFKIIGTITLLAVILVVFEKMTGRHFHSTIGYVKYNQQIKDVAPGGVFGLTFTFEAQGGQARFGAFFANPLEFSASMLITVALAVIMLLSVTYKSNKQKYLVLAGFAFVCVLLAYSRATFIAFFAMMVFMALMLKYYKLLATMFGLAVLTAFYIMFFAVDDVKYFVLDTITFENSSSVTHVIEWLQAVDSMITNPFGIGLATSGNAGGVDKDLQIGGENQFLIYGVQLGFIGMVLYLSMLIVGIKNSWRAFNRSESRKESVVPFIGASVKFGLIFALFTANAEAYLFISLVSWWLIGSGESLLRQSRQDLKRKTGQMTQEGL